MSTIQWSKATPEVRNALVASFMPPSPINPMSRVDLVFKGQGAIRRMDAKTVEEAQAALDLLRTSKRVWETNLPEVPWPARAEVSVCLFTWHARYSDTPGGAWMVLEQLRTKGFDFIIATTGGVSVTALQNGEWVAHEAGTFEQFAEVACRLFLTCHGVIILP